MKSTRILLEFFSRKKLANMADGKVFIKTLSPTRKPAKPTKNLSKLGNLNSEIIDGSVVWTFTPQNAKTGLNILYIPGGGYVHPIQTPHWWIIRSIALKTGATLTIPAYPLAPEHHYNETVNLLDKV